MDISNSETTKGRSVIVTEKQESQLLLQALLEYCENHPRKRIPKKILKQMESELGCF